MKFMSESVKARSQKPEVRNHNGLLSIVAVALIMLSSFKTVHADPLESVRDVKLDYNIYLGGLHVMDSATSFNRKGGSYTIQMRAEMQGFLSKIAPWNADLVSTGQMQKDKIRPHTGTIITRWRDEPTVVKFNFKNPKRIEAYFTPDKGSQDQNNVPDALLRGALDPLNAAVQVMTSFAYGKGCDQTIPVFDGHRRFDLELKDRGMVTIDADEYTVFGGQATKCEADLNMRAGSREDREGSKFWSGGRSKDWSPAIYVYLAPVREGLPAMPVRAETETAFGRVMIHLKNIESTSVKSAGL